MTATYELSTPLLEGSNAPTASSTSNSNSSVLFLEDSSSGASVPDSISVKERSVELIDKQGKSIPNALDTPSSLFDNTPIPSRRRKKPIKIEPKVFFSNERTFLAWMQTSVFLAGASIGIMSFAKANAFSMVYGLLMLPVAITFLVYSIVQYSRRSAMLRRKQPGPYEDVIGPVVLCSLLMISIMAQLGVKIYTMVTSKP